jgi:rhomboid protease GluP
MGRLTRKKKESASFSGALSSLLSHRPYVTLSLVLLNCLMFILTELSGGSRDIFVLISHGAKIGAFIWQGEYWRLLTSIFLHMGLSHLLLNLYCLIIFGTLLEESLGHWKMLLLYITAGMMGNLLSLKCSPSISTGASGALFGIIGALPAYMMLNRREFQKGLLPALMLALLPFLAYNVYSASIIRGIDYYAHLGGFVWGAMLGSYFGIVHRGGSAADERLAQARQLQMRIIVISLILSPMILFKSALIPNKEFIGRNYLYLGNLRHSQGRYGDAIAYLDQAAAVAPKDSDVLMLLGSCYIQQGKIQKGLVIWEDLLRKDRENSRLKANLSKIYLILAESARDAGHSKESLNYFKKSLALNPDGPQALAGLGDYDFEQGDYHECASKWRKSLARAPRDRALLLKLKALYSQIFIIECFPDNVSYKPPGKSPAEAQKLNLAGETLLGVSGNYEEALLKFHKAISIDPTCPLPYANIGLVYTVLGKYPESIDYFLLSSGLDGRNWEPCLGLGDCALARDDFVDALKYYRKALSLKPDSAAAHGRCAQLFLLEKKLDAAEKEVKRALLLQRDNPHLHRLLGDIALARHDESLYFKEMTSALALARAWKNQALEAYLLKRLQMKSKSDGE